MTPTVTQAEPVLPVAPRPVSGKLTSLKSLRSLKDVDLPVADSAPPGEDPAPAKVEFTEGHAIGVLNDFFKMRTSPNERLLLESGYDISGTHIRFKLPNTFLLSLFDTVKSDLLEYMKKKLRNADITADAVVTAAESLAKPRTEQQKFEAMAEKNPVLWDLKKGLDLDLIF